MIRFLARTSRPVRRPISRAALLALAWTQRYTVSLWFRSIRDELMHQYGNRSFDVGRWRRLLSSLWRVSSDHRLANAPELRRITVTDNTVTVDAEETWHARYLLDGALDLTPLRDPDPSTLASSEPLLAGHA